MRFTKTEIETLKNDFDALNTIKDILCIILKSRNDDIYNNIQRVNEYVNILATCIKSERLSGHEELNDSIIHSLVSVAQLHDIGKVGIPDSILLKPGSLTKDEFEVMKSHVHKGEAIIIDIENKLSHHNNSYLGMTKTLISTHHEWWDGNGYPHGLKGEQIPLVGRIMAVSDVYDALRNKRVYKPKLAHETVIEMMQDESGTHFDPVVIEALTKSHLLFNNISNTKF